jgi:adenylyltransferase/sulfurtransferase
LQEYETLRPDAKEFAAVMCGRHAVQVSPGYGARIDLDALRRKLEAAGEVKANDYLLRFRAGEYELTVFPDARSIIRGTDDIATARSLYSKYIGN